jgi:hypothetical protein
MDDPQVVERGGDIGVKLAMHGLANLQALEIHRLRFHILILPLAGIDLRQLWYVVYRACYGDRGLWTRPTVMFLESVIVDGHSCPRFQFLATL